MGIDGLRGATAGRMSSHRSRRRWIHAVDRTAAAWVRSSLFAALATLFVGVGGLATANAAIAACPNAGNRTGPSAALPDCRAYEQVSPVEKGGHGALSLDYPVQATANGEALMYLNLFAAYAGAPSSGLADAFVSRRSQEGWQAVSAAPPTPGPTPPGGDEATYMFTEDLREWVVDLPLQSLAEKATPGVYNLFRSSEGGGYSWVNDATPAHIPPEGCPAFLLVLCYQLVDRASPAGASVDFHHILFESTGSLIAGAPEGRGSLYESVEEAGKWHVGLVGLLPDGSIAGESTAGSGSSVEYGSFNFLVDNHIANAISSNGSHVVFQAPSDEGELPAEAGQAGMTEVYDRTGASETIELSAPAPGSKPANTAAQSAMYWGASANGSRVFFTTTAELTTNSDTGTAPKCESPPTECNRGDLYEYDLETKTLKDLTVDANLPADEEEGANVQGVVGVSGDGSYVYFVARGQLAPGKGIDGGYNLYVVHNGSVPAFIATLNQNDFKDWAEKEVELESYVTPDGRHLAFTTVNSLATENFPSGYDNVNETTATAEPEVYEYSASTESITCVSCDPSGDPPIGPGRVGSIGRGEVAGASDDSAFHRARVVSENGGRVFFSSRDPLVPAVKGNTEAKVYEYEQQGEGTCETHGGCTYLLSSPNSPEEEFFLDADSTGDNVFLATMSQLTSSDTDQLYDVYDARVNGGLPLPATQAPCSSGCRTTSNEAPLNANPLSGSIGTSGNLPAATQKPPETRADKLAKALNACQKKNKRRRRSCKAQAQKRYGKTAKARRSVLGGKRRGR